MSREKFNCPWIAAACPPMMRALAPSMLLLRLAARMPSSSVATDSSVAFFCGAMLRAMWRCVMWVSSCASTEASWSAVVVSCISPRCTPT